MSDSLVAVDALDAVVSWYQDRYDESGRLVGDPHSRLEAARTRELIGRHLGEEPLDVLDVGGGAGAYAGWLAGLGHRVHVVDPVPRHVEAAAGLDGVTAEVGDARRLAQPDGSQDVTLLLGPLYHLSERAERVRALAEARRVTRPGGRVFAAAIGRYCVFGEFALLGELTEENQRLLAPILEVGEPLHDGGFPLGHAHTADELAAEAAAAGWAEVEVYGVEGPLGFATDLVPDDRVEQVVEQMATAARMLERDPRVVDVNPHLLLTAVRPM